MKTFQSVSSAPCRYNKMLITLFLRAAKMSEEILMIAQTPVVNSCKLLGLCHEEPHSTFVYCVKQFFTQLVLTLVHRKIEGIETRMGRHE